MTACLVLLLGASLFSCCCLAGDTPIIEESALVALISLTLNPSMYLLCRNLHTSAKNSFQVGKEFATCVEDHTALLCEFHMPLLNTYYDK